MCHYGKNLGLEKEAARPTRACREWILQSMNFEQTFSEVLRMKYSPYMNSKALPDLGSAVHVSKAFLLGHDKFRFSRGRVTLSVLTSLLVSRPSLKALRSNTLSFRSCLSPGSVEANMNIKKKKKNPAWKRNAEWQGHYHFKGLFFMVTKFRTCRLSLVVSQSESVCGTSKARVSWE